MSDRSLGEIQKDMEIVLAGLDASSTAGNRVTRLLMLRILLDEADRVAAEPLVNKPAMNVVISRSTAA